MHKDIESYNAAQAAEDAAICAELAQQIDKGLPDAECKIWHAHPVWFLEGNPVAGYSKLKTGIRLMFWSGADFEEPLLIAGTGKFKDASITYTSKNDINTTNLKRWLKKSRDIQWDYKSLVKRKGVLERLK